MSDYCQVRNSVAVSSGTAALHVACLALGIEPGDQVWVSAVSFVASANCAAYCGARINFVDVGEANGLLCLTALKKRLKQAERANCLPKLLIVVHLAGQVCDMQAIFELCKKYDISLIEDASHALSSRYLNKPVGCCEYSDITVFSLHPVKPITSGEGGVLTTKSSDLADRARQFACHGIEKRPARFKYPSPGAWYYEQQVLGFNYRLSDIHAALGLSQLKRLDQAHAVRTRLAGIYDELLGSAGSLCAQSRNPACKSSYHLYVVLFDNPESRRQAYEHLRRSGYGVNVHYSLIPDQPFYKEQRTHGSIERSFPGAKSYSSRALSLPLYPGLSREALESVVNILLKTS